MNLSDLTSRQRRAIAVLAVLVIAFSAMLTGFIITSTQRLKGSFPPPTVTLASWPPTPPPTDEPSPVSLPADESLLPQVRIARLFEQIAYQVETLRGLPPRGEVALSFLDEEEIAVLVQEAYSARDLAAQLKPYVLLGLLPEVQVTVRPHPIVGVYLPEQGQLFITTDGQNDDPDNQALLAGAYSHALQDQHFDLGTIDARATTTDAALAARALVDGDALLLMALYRYQDLPAADWMHLVEIVDRETPGLGEPLDQVAAWSRLELFPIREGRELVQALFQTGGWEAVNRAYADLPRSTEQVLHPERYLQERDPPSPVVVPDISEALGSGWSLLLQDTLGEFATGLYLEGTLAEETAWQAANGWDGDTLAVWEAEDGRQVLVWRTIWDTIEDAAQFEHAMVALIQQRFVPAWPVDPPSDAAGRWWQTEAGIFHLERSARHVLLVRAPNLEISSVVAESVP